MRLTKQEKNLLAIENFFNEFKQEFEGVTFIAISTSIESYTRELNPTKNIFPFYIKVERVRNNVKQPDWLTYSWEVGASDDEFPLYTKSGEYLGFHEVKAYVEQALPEAFKGKSFYKQDTKINSDNISELTTSIKIKKSAINLADELPVKSDSTKRKLKI